MKPYICILCKKKIDDYGDNFCSKCRNKDWKKRFIAIKKAMKIQRQYGKRGSFIRNSPSLLKGYSFGSYFEKRREI